MIQSVNLNHTHLTNKLWAFRKGYFCSQKKKKESVSLTGFELTNPDWGKRNHEATPSVSLLYHQSFFGHTGAYVYCVLEWN